MRERLWKLTTDFSTEPPRSFMPFMGTFHGIAVKILRQEADVLNLDKNFVIYENITGVTDGKGEFALYDVSVTDNTIFTASYGTVNSNEVTIYHCIYRDYATSDNKSNYYINGSGGTTLNWSNGYYVLGLGASSNYVDLKSITDNVKGKTVNFKVDVVLNGTSIRLRVYNGNTVLANSPYTTSDGTVKVENVAIPSDATSILFRIERRYLTDGDSIKFKNFVIY